MSDERSIILLGEIKGGLEALQRSTDQRFGSLESTLQRVRTEASDNSEKNHALRDDAFKAHKESVSAEIQKLRGDLTSAIALVREVHAKVTEARGVIKGLMFHGPGGIGIIAFIMHFLKGHL